MIRFLEWLLRWKPTRFKPLRVRLQIATPGSVVINAEDLYLGDAIMLPGRHRPFVVDRVERLPHYLLAWGGDVAHAFCYEERVCVVRPLRHALTSAWLDIERKREEVIQSMGSSWALHPTNSARKRDQ